MAQQKQAGLKPKRSEYTVESDSNMTQQKSGDFVARKMFEYGRFSLEDRAIADYRDGHIPVQRRLLYSMHGLQPNPGGNFLKVARVTGECFVAGTTVQTENGLARIEDLRKGDVVLTSAGPRSVVELYTMPKQKLVTVTSEHGNSTTCTPGQKFRVVDWASRSLKWKAAKDLKTGDILLKSGNAPVDTAASSFGYLVGYYIGNGWFDKASRRVAFACPDPEVAATISSVIANVIGGQASISERKRGDKYSCSTVRISGTAAEDFVKRAGLLGCVAAEKSLVWSAFESTADLVGLVSGLLDSDGTYRTSNAKKLNRREVTYTTTSKTLAFDLRDLLARLGVHASVKCYARKSPQHKDSFQVNAVGAEAAKLCRIVKSRYEKKAQRAAAIAASSDMPDVRPLAGLHGAVRAALSAARISGSWYKTSKGKRQLAIQYRNGSSFDLKQKDRLSLTSYHSSTIGDAVAAIDKKLAAFIENLTSMHAVTDVVSDVVKAASDVTYDIQVEDMHEFFANGLLVSNCMGKYHPHSSAAVPLVNLTYARYPLVSGQGNFGSIKGDKAAAERYIECRLSKASRAHFACNNIMTTVKNYSDEFDEPLVISTRLPLLLMNGAQGTAVGYVTNIPSHNITELAPAFEYLARNWKTATTAGIMEFLKGPDDAFGGVLLSGKDELQELYENGVGSIRYSCDYKIEPNERYPNVTDIVVHGFPDAFRVKAFVGKTVPKLRAARTIVGYNEFYNKKTGELRLVLSVDNQAALKKVTAALQCSSTYRFNVTERKSDDENETEFMEHVPLLTLMRKWLLWRHDEEVKALKVELEKIKASKFLEDCKLLAMFNVGVLSAAVQQTKVEPNAYVVAALKGATIEQADAMLKFRLIDLKRLDEADLRKKIKELEAELAATERDLARPMVVVIRHLNKAAEELADARRTRTSGRLQDERRMQQTGDPIMFGTTVDGKLLGVIDDKGSNNSVVLATPSYEGYAAFGAAGIVDFFGTTDTGKAGAGLDKIVGIASREAPFLLAIGANGCYTKAEQDRDSNKTIPTFLRETELVFGAGVWDTDTLVAWDEHGNSKAFPISSLKTMRKNIKGVRLPFKIDKAMVVRADQILLTSDGRKVNARAAGSVGIDSVFAAGERNLVVFRNGRRKFMSLDALRSEIQRGDIVAVYDATLPKAE